MCNVWIDYQNKWEKNTACKYENLLGLRKDIKRLPYYFQVKRDPHLGAKTIPRNNLNNFGRGLHLPNFQSIGIIVSNKKIFKELICISLCKTSDPKGTAKHDPRGKV